MKKAAFKILTYISIFLVLPFLKLFGKKYYETKVVPKLLTVLCNTKPNHYQRKKVVPLATGDVVEIGVGPGLNLQYYNFEKVKKVIGIDPSDELNKIAKWGVCIAVIKPYNMMSIRICLPLRSTGKIKKT